MFKQLVLTSLFAAQALSSSHVHQQPLNDKHTELNNKPRVVDVIHELQRASIIPEILSPFTPKLGVSILWPAPANVTAGIGNTLAPSSLQQKPKITFVAPTAHDLARSRTPPLKRGMQLTLALTDPDAPSRGNPEWSQMCHWIVTGVPLSSLASTLFPPADGGAADDDDDGELEEIVEWKPPGPPPGTGKHRYVFVALAPANQTTERLQLSTPGDREHWGYGRERRGVGHWMKENGLVVVGANFIYSQNDKQ